MNGLILPQSTIQLIDRVFIAQRHPGLQLDKFSIPGNQMAQKQALDHVCRTSGDSGLLNDLAARRRSFWNTLPGYTAFRATTTSPLALHLARASALENAGICLHPLYGFAYLPGSGLKGMARAYAETVAVASLEDILAVFGNQPGEPNQAAQHAGTIIFHDAWPESWPKLIVDIVNNHHPEYYQAEPNDNAHPPGDWENPVPVYFLAVPPGVTFTFPLTKRHGDVPDRLVNLARDWLLGALCHLGAGAKTATGYGAFQPAEGNAPSPPSQRRLTFETTLELVTPAFLAGANQQAEDCDLRPATLRGLLRWWWRTMHAGFLDVRTLRALEAAIWGDTNSSGAVRILLEPTGDVSAQPYDKQNKAKFDDDHKKSAYGIPSEVNPKKITPGLWYASYGMDETSKGQRKQRHYLEPGARWRLRLVARSTRYFANRKDASDPAKARQGREITAEQALEQAKAALWLLCHFGGIGSKARKGFGSLATNMRYDFQLDTCRDTAKQLRQYLSLPNVFVERQAHSPSLEQMIPRKEQKPSPVEISFSWPNVWSVLDQVGFAYESAAHQRAHNLGKLALGLPRQIHGPRPSPLPHQNPATHRPPRRLHGPMGDRHSSPVHIHLERRDGGWTVRVIAFPAAHLPDLNTSRKFLEEFLRDFGDDLQRRSQLSPPSGPTGSASPPRGVAAPSRPSTGPTPVRVKFLGPHDKLKDAFWVQEEGKKRGLLKYGTPPNKRTPPTPLPAEGSEIEVYPTNNNPNSPEYRWDQPPQATSQPHGKQSPEGKRR